MSMQMMKNEPTIMWKCRFPKSRHLGEEADIIKVRLIWSCWYLGKSMKNFRILMLFFYVTLTRLGRRNIDTHFQVSTIFLSTHGENEDEVPKELVTFLRFVKAGLQESEQNFHDDYVEKLQRTIREIKRDREMEERFMILEEMLKDERKEGRIEGREEGRAEGARLSLCTILECRIPDMFRKQIETEQNLEVLRNWLVLAAKSDTMEAFLAEAESVKGRQCGQKE